MKKAEDYLQESFGWSNESQELTWYVKSWKDFIKRIQEEAIRETVQECANSACVIGNKSSVQYFTQVGSVDRNSILSIADKLIREL